MRKEEERGKEKGKGQGREKKKKTGTHLPGLPAQSGQVQGTRPPMQLWILGLPDILFAERMTLVVLGDAK